MSPGVSRSIGPALGKPGKAMPGREPRHAGHIPYPAICDCLRTGRQPSRDEIRVVAQRMWREAFQARSAEGSRVPSFAVRRVLIRAALVALTGSQSI